MSAGSSAIGRRRRGGFDDFVRGAELWMHSARMAAVAIGVILIGAIVVWIGGVLLYLGARQTPSESYYLLKYGQARLFESMGMTRGVIVLAVDGKEERRSPGEVVEALEPYRHKLERDLYNANLVAGLSAVFLVFAAGLYWREFGRKKMQDETVRGGGVIGSDEANRRIARAGAAGGFYLAGVPLPVGAEVKHLGMFGATGSGKTVAQLELLDQIRARGQPAVVYDAAGEFVRHFYRPGRDVLLNPLDQRSPAWSPFAELRAGYDYAALAGSLYPVRHDDPDKFWMQSAQRVFEEVLRSLAKKGRRSNAALYDALALSDLSDLARLLAGTPAAKYTAPSVERTAIDIQMTVQNSVSSFRYLHDDGEPFSIWDWVAAPEDQREVLVSREDVLKVAGQHAHGRFGIAALDQAFWKVPTETIRVRGTENETRQEPFLKAAKDGRWMLQKAYDSERYVVHAVRIDEGKIQALTTLGRANEVLDRLEAETRQRDPSFKYSAEQRHAARLVATTLSRYLNIQGDAGSGKTTVLRAIVQMAQAEGFQVRGMAVTGNAAQELAAATGLPAQTVARTLLVEREAARTARAFDAIDEGAHPRTKSLWIIDEASMLGQVDFGRLVHYADEARAKVLFAGDRHQLHAVPAGMPWEIVQAYGSPKAELHDNVRQRDPGERLAVDQVKRRQHVAALKGLAELGKVIVDASPVELVGRFAREWQARAQEGEAPLVGLVTHRARLAVNEAIRTERRAAGDIRGPELEAKILEPAQWTRAQIRSAVSYADHEGPLVVRFRRNYRSIGVRSGEYGRVGRVDEGIGRVTLDVSGRQVHWTPARGGEVEVYRGADRLIARGDWIVLTRDHGDLENKSRWDVLAVDERVGSITTRSMANGRIASIDLAKMPHWDHAYARTLHSLQGSTGERVLLHVESLHPILKEGRRTDAVLDQIFGTQGFYVGVTRQREGLTIYTNDAAALGGALRKPLEKSSALEGMREVPRLPTATQSRGSGQWRQAQRPETEVGGLRRVNDVLTDAEPQRASQRRLPVRER